MGRNWPKKGAGKKYISTRRHSTRKGPEAQKSLVHGDGYNSVGLVGRKRAGGFSLFSHFIPLSRA